MLDPIVTCSGLGKHYGAQPALIDLNLSLPRGQVIGLLGPNGSGKTTLIKLCAGLLTPSVGTLLIDGKAPGAETKAVVSYLPDRICYQQRMTISDILRLYEDFFFDFDRARAESMLQSLGIDATAPFKTLSKGTKEKVQLVMTMSRRASLYLLDEPIAGVDPAARDYILHTIFTNYDRNATVLLSTHLIADIENTMDSFVMLRYGQLLLQDSVRSFREREGKTVDEYFREVFRC